MGESIDGPQDFTSGCDTSIMRDLFVTFLAAESNLMRSTSAMNVSVKSDFDVVLNEGIYHGLVVMRDAELVESK